MGVLEYGTAVDEGSILPSCAGAGVVARALVESCVVDDAGAYVGSVGPAAVAASINAIGGSY